MPVSEIQTDVELNSEERYAVKFFEAVSQIETEGLSDSRSKDGQFHVVVRTELDTK